MDEHSNGIEIIKRIDAYLKGTLTEDQAEALWAELLDNPDYLEYLETELAVRSILQNRQSRETPVSIFHKPWRWVAAAVMGGVLFVAINFLQNPASPNALAFERISVAEGMESPEVLRSQASSLAGADSLMNLGFQAALAGDLDSALAIYNSIVRDFTGDSVLASAYLNIGIIRYNRQNFTAAVNAFEQTVSFDVENPFLNEKAYWYLGNAYLQQDRLPEAKEAINRTVSFDGFYRMPAERLLERIDEVP